MSVFLQNPDFGNVGGAERKAERAEMVSAQLAGRDIRDGRVLAAMAAVPRHRFVPANLQDAAYADEPLPIGYGQTISQPYIVALMTELVAPGPTGCILEIGAGCGYQTAVLAQLAGTVCAVEIVPALASLARANLAAAGVHNFELRVGDGRCGWPQRAPFAGILVAAAPLVVEPAWLEQLHEGGRLVVPLGDRHEQWLHCFTKEGGVVRAQRLIPVRFVPLLGG